MIYVGSKNRLSKYLVPIIQSYIDKNNIDTYIEPFVGGANIIDKIKCENRIGYDKDEYIIETLKALRDGWHPPYEVSKEEYIKIKNNKDEYKKELVGYVGYELSFGAKWFGGYVKRNDRKSHGDIYSYKSCMKQSPNLKGIEFYKNDFIDLKNIYNSLIYCDIPYKGTLQYSTSKNFPYEEFYQWCKDMSKDNIVLISEYNMPDEFECIWSKETTTQINSKRKANDESNKRVEKLYTYNH